MFRVLCDKPSGIDETQANQIVDQWLTDNTPWTDDPTPHEIRLVKGEITEQPEHFRGDVRFEFDDEKPELLEQIETDLAGITNWYRIGYHECSHDEGNGGPCSWDNAIEWTANNVTIPEGVPTFEKTP